MKKLLTALPILLLPVINAVPAADGPDSSAPDASRYLQVSVDNVVLNTAGLESASADLAASIEVLALAIRELSANNAQLSDDERAALLGAIRSVDEASRALAELARTLPATAADLTAQLPQVVREAREPIAELSSGLASARDGIYAITEALPEATENAKQLVDSALDAALIKVSIYTVILIAVLALALIGVFWFVYRRYIDPLAQKLDALTGAPEHFAAMALHMEKTSENLLALQTAAEAPEPPAIEAEPGPDEYEESAVTPPPEADNFDQNKT